MENIVRKGEIACNKYFLLFSQLFLSCMALIFLFQMLGWLVALRFNASPVGDAYVFPAFVIPVLTQLFFPKPPTTFLTCFCRGNTPERNFTSARDQTHNHQVMSQTHSPSSHLGGAYFKCNLKCRLQFVSIWTSLNFFCLVMD